MFFSIEWMAYRKMFAEAIISFIIMSAVSFGTSAIFIFGFGIPFITGRLIGNIFRLMAGFLGNLLYRKKAVRVLRAAKSDSDAERLNYLEQKGGVSVIGVIVCIVIEIAYVILMSL